MYEAEKELTANEKNEFSHKWQMILAYLILAYVITMLVIITGTILPILLWFTVPLLVAYIVVTVALMIFTWQLEKLTLELHTARFRRDDEDEE